MRADGFRRRRQDADVVPVVPAGAVALRGRCRHPGRLHRRRDREARARRELDAASTSRARTPAASSACWSSSARRRRRTWRRRQWSTPRPSTRSLRTRSERSSVPPSPSARRSRSRSSPNGLRGRLAFRTGLRVSARQVFVVSIAISFVLPSKKCPRGRFDHVSGKRSSQDRRTLAGGGNGSRNGRAEGRLPERCRSCSSHDVTLGLSPEPVCRTVQPRQVDYSQRRIAARAYFAGHPSGTPGSRRPAPAPLCYKQNPVP